MLASAIALFFGYVLAATYAVKLIPLYAGYTGRGSFTDVAAQYFLRIHALSANLNSVALGPATLIFILALAVVALIAVLEIQLIRGILACTKSSSFSARAPKPSSSAPFY
jgi:hypothetical protein